MGGQLLPLKELTWQARQTREAVLASLPLLALGTPGAPRAPDGQLDRDALEYFSILARLQRSVFAVDFQFADVVASVAHALTLGHRKQTCAQQ